MVLPGGGALVQQGGLVKLPGVGGGGWGGVGGVLG